MYLPISIYMYGFGSHTHIHVKLSYENIQNSLKLPSSQYLQTPTHPHLHLTSPRNPPTTTPYSYPPPPHLEVLASVAGLREGRQLLPELSSPHEAPEATLWHPVIPGGHEGSADLVRGVRV
jgi:hypothetical protein